MANPLTPSDLAILRQAAAIAQDVAAACPALHDPWLRRYAEDVPTLIAELDRLRNSQVAALSRLQSENVALKAALEETRERLERLRQRQESRRD